MPPIYAAVFHNQLNVVEYLLQLGVSLEHHGVKCRDPTAVHLAAALGPVENGGKFVIAAQHTCVGLRSYGDGMSSSRIAVQG